MTSATTNWRQRVRDSANRVGLPRFWRWWIGELAPLLPGISRAALQRRFARPVIELSNGQAQFWRPEINNGTARLSVTETVALTGDPAAVLGAGRAEKNIGGRLGRGAEDDRRRREKAGRGLGRGGRRGRAGSPDDDPDAAQPAA